MIMRPDEHRIAGRCLAVCGCLAIGLLAIAPSAKGDDFGKIVHHIEAQYHVHRNYRFLMSFTGVVVKCSHMAGVKGFKAAIFENQQLPGAELDHRLDELVERASASGWQPLVKSLSRRSGERSYIYAQASGNDMKLLLVNVESNEAVVMQLKINPANLSKFIDKHTRDANGD